MYNSSIKGVDPLPEVPLGNTVDSCLSTPGLGLPEYSLNSGWGCGHTPSSCLIEHLLCTRHSSACLLNMLASVILIVVLCTHFIPTL